MNFPKNWFFIRNRNNNYALSIERSSPGESVIISTLKESDNDLQLWRCDENGRIHNKMTGFVLDVGQDPAKVGSELILQSAYKPSANQTFILSSNGYIYLEKSPNLVLGIKESFFSRREGLHVYLQELNNSSEDSKQQRWDIMSVSSDETFVKLGGSVGSMNRKSSFGSSDDDSLDDTPENQLNSFPEKDFFLKSDTTGQFVGADINALNTSGARISLEPLRKSNYESQLWHFDKLTGRLINKFSGFCLMAEQFTEESFVCQSSNFAYKDLPHQSWYLTGGGEIKLKNSSYGNYVLGFKKEGWFNLNREGSPVLLQKQAENHATSHHKFTVVLPIFRRKTAEIVTVIKQKGVFPDGYFFIKNQKHNLVITVDETNQLAAEVLASSLDTKSFNRQLWRYENGFIFNKVSNLVLDVKGGCITSGSKVCQYTRKEQDYENQQWELSMDGHIYLKSNKNVVVAISEQKKDGSPIFLANRKTPDYEEQRWNFVLPVVQQKSSSVRETFIQTTVSTHQYAQYPSGWFLIRSFIGGPSNKTPFVITADRSTHNVCLTPISKENWRHQLWSYYNGILVNFASQLAIDIDNIIVGSNVCQEPRQTNSISQRFYLTVDGYLVHGSDPSLILIPESIPKNQEKFKIALAEYAPAKDEYHWGFLTPEVKFENNTQTLLRWSVTLLSEWKNSSKQSFQKVTHHIADWPEVPFFITDDDEMALVPEKSEAFSFVTFKQLDYEQSGHFEWSFRGGYLVHVATGLVLHAADDLVGGSQLQIREKLLTSSKSIDRRQRWIIKTDGSIVSEVKSDLGIALLQQENEYLIQLSFLNNTSQHYCWNIIHGQYESHYSEAYKKNVNIVSYTERILLTTQSQQVPARSGSQLISSASGVFPESWFYICSKSEKSLVLTIPSKDEGAKLILSKLNYGMFRQQLWRLQDDGCLVNFDSGYVLDVAGGGLNAGDTIIQWHQKYLKRSRKNQLWTLSTDGHIHPKSHPSLVLEPKDKKAVEGSGIQLAIRGALDLHHQLWTFAIPIFKDEAKGISTVGSFEKTSSTTIFVDNMQEFSFKTLTTETYKSENKVTVVRRNGIFPDDKFFIRCSYGDERLCLAVEKKPRTGENKSIEYQVILSPMDFSEYQWYLWYYEDGHLLNVQTGLALDATPAKGVLVEEDLCTPLFIREKSMTNNQFWTLAANGEIHLRSDERFVIGPSNITRATTSGAQIGIQKVRVRKHINEVKQQETLLESKPWLRWTFSKPVYSTKTDISTFGKTLEGMDDQKFVIEQKEETIDEISEDDSDDTASEATTNIETSTSGSSKTNLFSGISIAASAGILTGATGIISKIFSSDPESMLPEEAKLAERSIDSGHKDSFNLDIDYIPTGSEKVLRYNTHGKFNFPATGYFMVKSYLYSGYVLDVVDSTQTKDGSYVALTPIKSTDFASQLWSYRNGHLVNVKGYNLVLDASETDTSESQKRAKVSIQPVSQEAGSRSWVLQTSSGLISLKMNNRVVLGVKDIKRMSTLNKSIEVYIQEEKPQITESLVAHPEQRWEILIPSMVPISGNTASVSQSRYTIIESGKISCISSSACAIIAFDALKHTYLHKISRDDQWPSPQNWFFIRAGTENAFLSPGTTDSNEVKFVILKDKEDHKQFLWMSVNGYLVNYKYMMRLVYDFKTKKLQLSKNEDNLDYTFSISSKGKLLLKSKNETIYLNVSSSTKFLGEGRFYQVNASKQESKAQENFIQLHIPVFSSYNFTKDSRLAATASVSWLYSVQKTIFATSSNATNVTKIAQTYGLFPHGTWFFIKATSKEGDSLVISVEGASNDTGASLVLENLSFSNYKQQLWTFRDGLLVNFGSKLVIDVDTEVKGLAKLVQSPEAGVSTQRWSLSSTGNIYLKSYSNYALGYNQAGVLEAGSPLILVKNDGSSEGTIKNGIIVWKFSTPIFTEIESAKNAIETTSTTSINRMTSFVESGATIQTLKEVKIQVEDVSSKSSTADVAALSKLVTNSTQDTDSTGFQHSVASADSITTSESIKITNIKKETTVKTFEDLYRIQMESNTTSSTSKKTQNTESKTPSSLERFTSASTDTDKVSETISVYRGKSSSVQVINDSRSIVKAWTIIFRRRIKMCKTKNEMIQTIEESQQDLFRRLDEHLRVHASTEKLVSGSIPEWHVFIQQVKEIYRARFFETSLNTLNSEKDFAIGSIDFDSVLKATTDEAERHYNFLIESESKRFEQSTSSSIEQSSQLLQELQNRDDFLVSIDNIKVAVRYWLIGLYEAISTAQTKGEPKEHVNVIIDRSRDELFKEFSKIKTVSSTALSHSASKSLSTKQSSINNSIENAIKRTEAIVNDYLKYIGLEKLQDFSEVDWSQITRTTEATLSRELKVYQYNITQELSEVQQEDTQYSDKQEIAVALDEKLITVAQEIVTKKLIEAETKISTWFVEVSQNTSYLIAESQASNTTVCELKQNILAIIDASYVELAAFIEEVKLVVRTQYAHLTYLSWAERQRVEYSLENAKTAIAANITYFKKAANRTDLTKDQIRRYLSYSFGATASRLVLDDVQSIIKKVSHVQKVSHLASKTYQTVSTDESKEKIRTANASAGSKVIEKLDSQQQSASIADSYDLFNSDKANEVLLGSGIATVGTSVAIKATESIRDKVNLSKTTTENEARGIKKSITKTKDQEIKMTQKSEQTKNEHDFNSYHSESFESDNRTSGFKSKVSFIDASEYLTDKKAVSVTNIVNEWYEQLIFDVSTCAKKGGVYATADIEVIVEKALKTFKQKLYLLRDRSITEVKLSNEYQASIIWVEQLVTQSVSQIKLIGINAATSASKTGGIEQMRPICASVRDQVDLETYRYKFTGEKSDIKTTKEKSIAVSTKDTSKSSTATIVIAVENFQSAVSRWQTKLAEEIHIICTESRIKNKEERINELAKQVSSEIEQISIDTKKQVSEYCNNSAEKHYKVEEQEILNQIDYVRQMFINDTKKIRQISIESLRNSNTNIKNATTLITKSSATQMESAFSGVLKLVVSTTSSEYDEVRTKSQETLGRSKDTVKKQMSSSSSQEKCDAYVEERSNRESKEISEEKASSMHGVLKGTLAAGTVAGAHFYDKTRDEVKKSMKRHDILKTHKSLEYNSGASVIDNVNNTIAQWTKSLVEDISVARKSGQPSQSIKATIEEYITELDQIIEYTKVTGSKYYSSVKDKEGFAKSVDCVSSVAKLQTTQIEEVALDSTISSSDVATRMQSLVATTNSQISVIFKQLKSTVGSYEKSSHTEREVKSLNVKEAIKVETSADKTKDVHTIIQSTRVTAAALLATLSDCITARIKKGGSFLQEDINKMIESTQKDINRLLTQAQTRCSSVTSIEMDQELSSIQVSVEEQISEIKKTVVEATSSNDANVAISKIAEATRTSERKTEADFTSISENTATSRVTAARPAQKKTDAVQNCDSNLSSKSTKMLEKKDYSDEELKSRVRKVLSASEHETTTREIKSQEQSSRKIFDTSRHLDVFDGSHKGDTVSQLNVLENAVEKADKTDTIKTINAVQATEEDVKKLTRTDYETVETIASMDTVKVASSEHKSVSQKNAATNVTATKEEDKPYRTTIEVSFQEVQVAVDKWFTRLAEKVIACIKKQDANKSAELVLIVKEAQSELEIYIRQTKKRHFGTSNVESKNNESVLEAALEYIKMQALTHTSQITQIVAQSTTSNSLELITKVENHVFITKQKLNTVLRAHYTSKTSQINSSHSSEEKIQKRFESESKAITENSKNQLVFLLSQLLSELIIALYNTSSTTIRLNMIQRIETAKKDFTAHIDQIKDQFTSSINGYYQQQTLATSALHQTVSCLENMKTFIMMQLSLLKNELNRTKAEDITVITERMEAILYRTQTRVQRTLEMDIYVAISSAFKGKTVHLSEPAFIPRSFNNVQVIAFDILGTVVDYPQSVYQQTMVNQEGIAIGFETFMYDWQTSFNEIKRESLYKKCLVPDIHLRHNSLLKVLRHHQISLSQFEIEQLCAGWNNKLTVYDDAAEGIRRLKNKFPIVAISNTLSTRSLMNLSQSNCLCWNAQFSADMFESQVACHSVTEALVRGTIRLLGLDNPKQLAIVSSNNKLVNESRKLGCHAILIDRRSKNTTSTTADKESIKVSGVDVLAESVQLFFEQESVSSEYHTPEFDHVLIQSYAK